MKAQSTPNCLLSFTMIKFVVFSALLSVAFAGGKKCPWVAGKNPFDAARFAGDWMVVAGSPMIGGPHRCGKFEYKITQDIHTLKYTGINEDGSKAFGDSYGQATSKCSPASSYMAVWRKDNEAYSPVFKQTVVDTDYENYAVLIACTQVFDEKSKSFIRVIKGGILARPEKSLSEDQLHILKNQLTSLDFDVKELKFVEYKGCPK